VRDDLRNRAVHSYIDLYAPLHPVSLELLLTNNHYLISVVFYGRRPESSWMEHLPTLSHLPSYIQKERRSRDDKEMQLLHAWNIPYILINEETQ
jgi:hypothetical protein